MLGIVSENEFNNAVNDSKNAPALVRNRIKDPTNRTGKETIGDSVKKVLIDEALTSGKNKEIARILGVGESSVEHLKFGRNSNSKKDYEVNDDLKEFISKRKNALAEVAMDRLGAAMESISDDKLAAASLRESSAVAKDMASVVRDMTAKDNDNNGNQMAVQFVLHAPDIKQISDYEVVQLEE